MPPRAVPPHVALGRLVKVGGLTARRLVRPAALTVVAHGLHLLQGNAFVRAVNNTRTGVAGTGVVKPLAGALGITGIELAAQHARRKAWRGAALDFRGELRAAVIESIARQDLAFFDGHGTGQLLNLITDDTQRVGDFAEQLPDQLIEKAMTALYAAITLVRLSPKFALTAALPLPLLLLPSLLMGRGMARRFAHAGAMRGDYAQSIESMLSGITDVKLFQAEDRVAGRLRAQAVRMNAAVLGAFSSATTAGLLTQGIGAVSFAVVAAHGGALARGGRITGEDFARILYLYPMLLSAVGDIQGLLGTYQDAADAARRVGALLDTVPSIVSGPERLPAAAGHIALDRVSFGYDGSRAVLHDVSFEAARGEMVAIVGRSGSGKSTLLRLIARLYDVESGVGGGRITLDGRDLRDLDTGDLRREIALVSQETYLFDGTIRDNLLYGKPDASDADLIAALRQAGAADLLRRLPDKLDAEVGERGGRLSGGERQRVAIARTILRGSPILLLDEITSHLDYETEDKIRRSIDRIAADRTVIVVTHRLATIRKATRIVVLEAGRVAEVGSHRDLVEQGGVYAKLWRLQTGVAPPRQTRAATPA